MRWELETPRPGRSPNPTNKASLPADGVVKKARVDENDRTNSQRTSCFLCGGDETGGAHILTYPGLSARQKSRAFEPGSARHSAHHSAASPEAWLRRSAVD